MMAMHSMEFVTFSIELAGVHAILAMRVPHMVLYLAQTMSLDASSIRWTTQSHTQKMGLTLELLSEM
jgi:hypothetical protein